MKNLYYNFKNLNFIKVCKIAIGGSIAILIANILGLSYSASAGIITLLSIQDTKKETLVVAGKRILAFLLALLVAFVLFQTLGYYTLVFGGFLFIFVGLSYLLGLSDGVAMCSVLITHFLIEKNMQGAFIINEILIFLIGTAVGVCLNMFMPGNEKSVIKDIRILEENMRNILMKMADCILVDRQGDCKEKNITECLKGCSLEGDLDNLQKVLKKSLTKAYNNMNNTLLSDTRYYLEYFTMRQNQLNILTHIKEQMRLLTVVPKQAVPISLFLKKIAGEFHEYNNAMGLLLELKEIKEAYKEEPSPVDREEFENRAVLYLILYDLEEFLNIKKNFVNEITSKQIERFWKVK